MITVESLTRRYAGFTVVDNVSFTAQPGRVTGFRGSNGAGKSTPGRVMVGLTAPTSGIATIDGGGVGTIRRDVGELALPCPVDRRASVASEPACSSAQCMY